MKILCFGSLNIDYTYKVDHFVQKGETLSWEALHVFSGGKGLNQSIALAKAGAEVYHAEAMDLAEKASAIAVTRRGASTSIPKRNEVLEFETN